MPRLAIAQLRPTKGDYGANLQKIGGVLAQVAKLDPPVDLVVFPETATSGYFVEGGVRDVAVTAGTLFRDLTVEHEAAGAGPVDVAIGFYEVFQNHFYNSCLYASLGGKDAGVRQVHRKVFLPTYGVFDEERFVDRGREIRAFDTRWGRAAILICEDAWHSLSGTIAALQGAQLVIVPSASPARGTGMDEEGIRLPASVVRWERILRGMADEHGVWVAFASLVGFEGGKGFPGGSVVVSPAGDIVLRGPLFEEAVLTYDVDFEEITRARAEAPLLADLEVNLPHLIKSLGSRERGSQAGHREVRPGYERYCSPLPAPCSQDPRGGARGGGRRPAADRCRLGSAVAGQLLKRRSRAPSRVHQGDRGALGRRGLVAHRVPRRRSTRQGERDRRADAVSDVLAGEPGPRVARDPDARDPVGHDRHLRGGGRLPRPGGAERGRRSHAPWQRDGAGAHDRAVRPVGEIQSPADRHEQQIGATARLFHLARRRHAAREPAGRPVQDAGARPGASRGSARGDPAEAAHARPRARADD